MINYGRKIVLIYLASLANKAFSVLFTHYDVIIGEFLHNTLHTLHTLINNITQCVLGDISKSHISNVSKTHWQFQCVLWNIEFKYIIFSITHWHSQCVLETFMYLEFVFLWKHWDSHFKYKVIIQMSMSIVLSKYSGWQLKLNNSPPDLRKGCKWRFFSRLGLAFFEV